ncbi:MAG: VOC family protein [Candidatus Latescibacteria bacterium]|jgi:methylmalonyl-CoA/ethylmalonyl-CoA epimerase|nr:VOC family protein [Candidatus Latescibacterota bacterium]
MSDTASFGLSKIGQISVRVEDLDRAVTFYRDTLGMKYLFQVPTMAFFDCGGVRLMLGTAEKPEFDHPASIIYYDVEDIQAAHDELDRRGIAFESAPHKIADLGDRELWMAFFRDSEENLLATMSEIPKTT